MGMSISLGNNIGNLKSNSSSGIFNEKNGITYLNQDTVYDFTSFYLGPNATLSTKSNSGGNIFIKIKDDLTIAGNIILKNKGFVGLNVGKPKRVISQQISKSLVNSKNKTFKTFTQININSGNGNGNDCGGGCIVFLVSGKTTIESSANIDVSSDKGNDGMFVVLCKEILDYGNYILGKDGEKILQITMI